MGAPFPNINCHIQLKPNNLSILPTLKFTQIAYDRKHWTFMISKAKKINADEIGNAESNFFAKRCAKIRYFIMGVPAVTFCSQ